MNVLIKKSKLCYMHEIEKMQAEISEKLYQIDHRKVKDRYASSKFYMNNFKKGKTKKK